MAWMKSQKSGKYYLTHEFTAVSDVQNPTQISAALGFDAELATSATITREITRAKTNRAELVKDISDQVLAGVQAGVSAAPAIDYARIAREVEKKLADDFEDIPEEVVDEFGGRLRS